MRLRLEFHIGAPLLLYGIQQEARSLWLCLGLLLVQPRRWTVHWRVLTAVAVHLGLDLPQLLESLLPLLQGVTLFEAVLDVLRDGVHVDDWVGCQVVAHSFFDSAEAALVVPYRALDQLCALERVAEPSLLQSAALSPL